MGARFKYYLISGFVPVFVQRHDMRLRTGLFCNANAEAAKIFYRDHDAKLPITKKLVDFDNRTALYFLKYNVDDLIIMIRSNTYSNAVKAFDSFRCLVALVYNWYSDEMEIIPLQTKPSFTKTQIHDLAKLASAIDETMFQLDLHNGTQISDRDVLDIESLLRKVFICPNIRRALACFCLSQTIYYTHLVGSYVYSHSRPELISASIEEYRQSNYRYQEMLHASLLICYRGIEAFYSKTFRSRDFEKAGRSMLESYLDTRLPNASSRSKYPLQFYRQREKKPPKRKYIVTMLEVLFRARNRAAHGYRWSHKHKFETFGSDLVDESKFFLRHIIMNALR